MTALLARAATRCTASLRRLYLASGVGLLVLLGCSPWNRETSRGITLLKPPRMSPDSVVLELALVDVTTDAQASVSQLWRRVDEQVLPLENRRQLQRCGFRCGVIGAQLPQWLTRLLEQQAERPKLEPEGGTVVVGEHLAQRRLQARSGEERSVPVGKHHKTLTIDVENEQGERETQEFTDAQVFLSILSQSSGDGRVQLELVPEIQHGPMRHRWVGDEGFFRMDTGREVQKFPQLAVQVNLLPGQTMVLGSIAEAPGDAPTPESVLNDEAGEGTAALTADDFAEFAPESTPSLALLESPHRFGNLAQAMFPPRPEFGRAGRLLLLRLAQTQQDDLFAPPPGLTPIATLRQ